MTALQFLYWILGVTQLCWLDSNQQFLTNYTIQLIQKHFELVKEIETDKPLFEEAEKVSIYFNFGYKSRFVLVNDDLKEIQSSILKLTESSEDPFSLAYYLQGAFEIAPELSEKMIVKKELISTFPDCYLKTMIEGYFFFTGEKVLIPQALPRLKETLNKIFIDVTPSYGTEDHKIFTEEILSQNANYLGW